MFAFSSAAHAGTTSSTLEVTFTVRPACNVTVAPLAFAATAGSTAEAQAPIEVACTTNADVQVLLDSGAHAAGNQRRMTADTGQSVPYAIYSDAARTQGWDAGPVVGPVAPDQALQLVAYGRVEAEHSAVDAGEYRDSVTVTVIF